MKRARQTSRTVVTLKWGIFAASVLTLLPALRAAEITPPRPPAETAAAISLPRGFTATLFACEPDVVQPIGMAIDDRGRIWIAENLSYPNWKSEGTDRITIIEDSDKDGRHDRRTVFYDKLNYVTGLEVGFGGVWVVSAPNLLFIPDADGDDRPDGPPEVLLDGFGHQGVHNLVNGCTWGPDGWLYGGHGGSSSGMIGTPGTKDADRVFFDGGVWRYHPTKRRFEAFMRGTTNPWGVDFDDHGQAFISNSVTPHLYHAIQGAHVERRRPSPSSRYAYDVIPPIADHKHWVGDAWNKSGGGTAPQVAVGGGHAHSGCMVYLGGAFPDRYRNTVFMVNIHGDRVNNDLPEPRGSGYVARHGDDFLACADPWFQGLQLRYGPDGSVYLTDWYDTGECHTRNPDTRNGRIYKITYRDADADADLLFAGGIHWPMGDLAKLTGEELVPLHLHPNDFFVRHARRVLQERGKADEATHRALRDILDTHPDVTRKLRALWSLHVTGGLTHDDLRALLDHPEEHVRAWAIQLACEDGEPPVMLRVKCQKLARADPSPRVCLALASAAQRWTVGNRLGLVHFLAQRDDLASDPNFPLMVWYAMEPLVKSTPESMSLVAKSKLPRLREFAARRLAE